MAKLWLHPQQVAILASYWPYQVQAHWAVAHGGKKQALQVQAVQGTVKRLNHTRLAKPGWVAEVYLEKDGDGAVNLMVSEVLLELYALQDLPQLPGRALAQVVRALNLWGTRFEQFVEVRVLDSWLNHLTLDVHAGDYHHQVKLSSWGSVLVRNVRADRRDSSAVGLPEAFTWQPLGGQYVLDVYERLRQLHVAVGPVSSCQQTMREGKPYGEPEHYVRKALPVEEGEPADGSQNPPPDA